MEYKTYQLANGLRVVHSPSEAPVVYLGYRLAVGSRDEAEGEEGLAHLCEHMSFKGTERRRAWQVMSCLERVGGDLNAFTTKEDTTFHAAVLREHVGRALDLLTDIVFHSTYPRHETEKEVEVVCDEIESYNDSPAELIYDDFENLLFHGHPLGHNILGEAGRVRTFTDADVRRFTSRHYRPDNAVLFIMGGELPAVIKRSLTHGSLTHGSLTPNPSPSGEGSNYSQAIGLQREEYTPQIKSQEEIVSTPLSPWRGAGGEAFLGEALIRHRGTHQSHVMLGAAAYPVGHPLRMALYLFNNIIAGPGMNALLNMELRERRGLVYTVEGALASYRDTGSWTVYFGCDPSDVDRCLRLTHSKIAHFIEKPLTETQLRAAKKQLKGQLGVASDNREAMALDVSKSFLHQGVPRDVMSLFPLIDAITPEQLQQAVREVCAPERLHTLIYNP